MMSQLLQHQEAHSAAKLQPPLWLVCVGLAYPTYWSMTFLLRAVPALVNVAFFGHQLPFFECSFRGARAATFPAPLVDGFKPNLRQAERDPLIITLQLMVAAILLLLRMPQRWRPLYGFGLATAGWVGLSPWLSRWTFQGELRALVVLALLFCFSAEVLGLCWLAGWEANSGVWSRTLHLVVSWVFPLLALTVLLGQRFCWPPYLWQFSLGAVAALLAAVASQLGPTTKGSVAWPASRGVVASALGSLFLLGLLKSFAPRLQPGVHHARAPLSL